MAKRRSFRDSVDTSLVPLIVVILVPLAAIAYLVFASDLNAAPAAAPSTQQSVQQPSAPAAPPQADISLDDPSSLPTQVSAAELVPFSFSVENPSSEDVQYQYRVTVRWSTGESDVIDENTLSLAAGASTTINEELKFEIATETAEVSIGLPQTDQSVQFALPR